MLGAIFVPLSPLFSYKTMVIYNVVPLKFSRTRTISYIVTVTRDVELIEILKLASWKQISILIFIRAKWFKRL